MPRREQPIIHDFRSLSPGEMYDVTQTNEDIKDGDVFVCWSGKEGTAIDPTSAPVVGFLMKAWPVHLFGEQHRLALHLIEPGKEAGFEAEYPKTFELAREAAKNLNLDLTIAKYTWPDGYKE